MRCQELRLDHTYHVIKHTAFKTYFLSFFISYLSVGKHTYQPVSHLPRDQTVRLLGSSTKPDDYLSLCDPISLLPTHLDHTYHVIKLGGLLTKYNYLYYV